MIWIATGSVGVLWVAATIAAARYATPPWALRKRYWHLLWPYPRWAEIERVAPPDDAVILRVYRDRGRYWLWLIRAAPLVPVVFLLHVLAWSILG